MLQDERFVTVWTLDVAERDFDKLSGEVTAQLGRKRVAGLIETAVLGNEARTQLWLISHWESQHLWAQSRWDQDIGQIVTDLVETAANYHSETLIPILVMRWPSQA